VGEVYVPNKVDVRGRRFGFAKFLEVKNVEELSKSLEEVWCGTYKLRVNLSRFGRTTNKKPEVQPGNNKTVATNKETQISSSDGRIFLEALGGGEKNAASQAKGKEIATVKGLGKQNLALTPLSIEPDAIFLSVLECSYVGRLLKGRNIKTLQLNLCLEGFRNIKAASMGDEKVLIFSDSGEDVGLAIKKKVWWEGILDKFQPWNPSMVASNREVWVRIFGVPVQLWTEYVFRSILKPWGIVVGLD
jgi:hypothetical protein